MSHTTVAIDPGTTTGLCVYKGGRLGFWQLGPNPHHYRLEQFLKKWYPNLIICEEFTFRPNRNRRKVVLDSKEYIGVVKLWTQKPGVEAELVLQYASQAKGFWTNDKLKQLGLYRSSMRHAMDALRHLLYYRTFTLQDDTWIRQLK